MTVDPLRVLMVSNVPLDESLGSGYIVLGYSRELRALGHHVKMLGPSDYELLYGLRRGIRYRQALGMVIAGLREAPYHDLVVFFGGEAWIALALLSRVRDRRFGLVSHSNGLEPVASRFLAAAEIGPTARYQLDLSQAFLSGFRRADVVVTVSEFEAAAARDLGLPEDKLLCLPNPLPTEYLDRPFVAERRRIVGYCGSWIPRKGTAVISADLPIFLREFPDWRLMVVGVGHDFRLPESFSADLMSRVTVIPHADRSALRELYSSFAVTIVPSIYESFGMVTAEAMACGSAVVTTPVGLGWSLRPDQEAVILEEPRSPALLAALARLAADEPLRRHIAASGWARAQELRWSPSARALESRYRALLAHRRVSGSQLV